jgi:drug/metabolite transporter (DMT)-like permease
MDLSARARQQPTAWGTAAALTAVVSWGLGNVLVKYIRLSGLSLALNRLCLGSVVYTGVFVLAGGRLTWRSLRLALPGGIAFGTDVALFFTAVKHTSVADASIITALQPALVFVVAGRLFGERITVRTVIWTAIAVLGVAVAVLGSAHGAGRSTAGDLLSVASLGAWAWYFIASKRSRRQLGALEYQAALTIIAAVVVAPFALASARDILVPDAATAGWVLVMVCVPGGGHLLMNWAHRYAPITLTSLVTVGIPVVALLGAAVLLGEAVSLVQMLGVLTVVIALGVLLWRLPGEVEAEVVETEVS